MRFSISLLTVICIASIIGTVVRQHEPFPNYVNQFGPFWAEVFRAVDLYTVYGAWWFLLILAFLVLSTSLCIARNTPKILADLSQLQGAAARAGLAGLPPEGPNDGSTSSPQQRPSASARCCAPDGWKVEGRCRDRVAAS